LVLIDRTRSQLLVVDLQEKTLRVLAVGIARSARTPDEIGASRTRTSPR
jgi:hypothetical protein